MHADERENQLPEQAAARSASSAARSAAATAALIWRSRPAKSPAGSDSTSDGTLHVGLAGKLRLRVALVLPRGLLHQLDVAPRAPRTPPAGSRSA